MKILSAIGMFVLVFALMSGAAFAIGYCVDIAPTDPPDKTFDDEWTGIVGEEIEIDVYLNDVPERILTAGIFMLPYQYPGEEVTDIQIYDGVYGPPGPWAPFSIPCWVLCAGLPPYPVSFTVGNFDGAQPDGDGDIIMCTIRLRFFQEGDYSIVFSTLPDFDTVIGFDTSTVYDSQISSNVITIHQIIADSDADGIPDGEDNCPTDYNPGQEDSEFPSGDGIGDVCDNCPEEENPLQEDNFPPQGNGIGDACDCEGNFDGDKDVDGGEAALFKYYFGRSLFNIPCTNEDPCNGDFDCDEDVDGSDASRFKTDFGRSGFFRMCQEVTTDPWCVYE